MTADNRGAASVSPGDQVLYSPARGRLVPLEDVPDEMFAEKMLGDGFAVDPTDGVFRAAIAGELVLVADTLHAFAIRSAAGLEVLVHIGIDTVTLGAAGFTSARRAGDTVERGDEIIACDLQQVAGLVPSMITPVIVTNGDDFTIVSTDLTAAPGEPVAVVART